MLLLIDNYDSFTYNLYQYIGHFEKDIKVVRNDKITIEDIEKMNPDHIVLSPGPKTPKEAGICIELIQHFYKKKPILGICLGHQSIGDALGGVVKHAKSLYHGKSSVIEFNKDPIFNGIESPVQVARYHSLIVEKDSLPEDLSILSEYEGEIMAMKHKSYPVYGLQFHPESILTEHGMTIIENFLKIR
jgi:anthranilate synthase component 2